MNRISAVLGLLGVLALGLARSVFAAEGADPGTAAYLDNQVHPIAPGASLWYRFDYVGDRSQITLKLLWGNGSGIAFAVLTPEQARQWWDVTPVGRGTAQMLDCETGEPSDTGECPSDDLTWIGRFNAPGTYFVQVVNHNPGPASFQLTIEGTGVMLAAPAPAATAAPTAPIAPPPSPNPPTLLPTTGGVVE